MSSLQSLDRALDMLNLINENNGKMSVSDISKSMDLHRSTVHRTLNTLFQKDFLTKDSKTGLYVIGPKALILGLTAADNLEITSISKPFMAFLSEKYSLSLSLSVIQGSNSLVINHYAGYNTTTFYSQYDNPLNCHAYRPAIADCMIGFNCKLEKDNNVLQLYFLKSTNRDNKNPNYSNIDELVSHLKKVKTDGYAYECGEYHSDEACYSVPVYQGKRAIAVLSMYGKSTIVNSFNKIDLVKELLSISKTISNSLTSENIESK